MSKKLRCIIVDDEPPAIRLLEKYVAKVSFLTLSETFTKPLEALHYLEQNSVDLIFLDIQMPEITGIQLSKLLDKKARVIFTTAYSEFAIESYDVAAVDYLLKPIEFERFYKAIKKISPTEQQHSSSLMLEDYIFIKSDSKNKYTKVFLKEIQFLQGLKNYVAIQLDKRQMITYSTLKHFKETMPASNFVQIHKSYIVSVQHIDRVENDAVWVREQQLPIGNTYRKSFFEHIKKKKF